MPDAVTIRPLETVSDFRNVEALQRAVWPGSELDVVPMHLLTTVAHNGGVVLGAFDRDQLVGYIFGFLGTEERDPERPALARLKCCSHQLGVLPGCRNRGIGRQLKLAQRQWALDQGIRLVTWTYDPLESRNATLNINRLGAVCQTYRREVYGQMQDGLNRGLPSDRFQVDWWITSDRVRTRISGRHPRLSAAQMLAAGATPVNAVGATAAGWPTPPDEPRWPESPLALVEIPTDFQSLKRSAQNLALAWRLHTREVFERLFAAGYLVTDFIYEPEPVPRGLYLLTVAD